MMKYIAVSGVIGSGKTELAKKLAFHYHAKLVLEEFATNSILPKFYKDPERYAFPLEISFLFERFQQLNIEFSRTDMFTDTYISDYFFDKSLLFARINLQADQFNMFKTMFKAFREQVPSPQQLIYLHRPIGCLLNNIMKRGRSFEQEIQAGYLESLQEAYFDYFKTIYDFPVIVLELKDMDFLSDKELLIKIFETSDKKFNPGLNIVSF
jgi:deoxyguanosine kinase